MNDLEAFDVVVAGGGPAGLSALHWCIELGLDAVVLERNSDIGGQLLHTYNPITNYPGVAAANGSELRDRFLQTMQCTDTRVLTGVEIVKADLARKAFVGTDGKAYRGRTLIVATGVRRRELGIAGEREFRGRGVLHSGARDRELVEGKRVVIIGGGDAALENATILADLAAEIYVVHRRDQFAARETFLHAARARPNVEFITDTRVTAIGGDSSVKTAELEHLRTGRLTTIETDAVLIRIGVTPNTEIFRGQAETDDGGYIRVGRNCETSEPGVFAIGDVSNRAAPTVTGAMGDGATAARAAFDHLSI